MIRCQAQKLPPGLGVFHRTFHILDINKNVPSWRFSRTGRETYLSNFIQPNKSECVFTKSLCNLYLIHNQMPNDLNMSSADSKDSTCPLRMSSLERA
jgi:hypothetical protein